MKLTREQKLNIIERAATLLVDEKFGYACNALKSAVNDESIEGDYFETQNAIVNEFWMCVMLDSPNTDSASTAEGRLSRINPFEFYEYNIELRLMMLAWYYELVLRGHTFKDYRHAT